MQSINPKYNLKNEEGTTLIETLVAMAILVSVLLPTAMFLGYITTNPINKEKIKALGMAQTEMESILNNKRYQSAKKEIGEKWLIIDSTSVKNRLVNINVLVYKKHRSKPLVTLRTERLYYDKKNEH